MSSGRACPTRRRQDKASTAEAAKAAHRRLDKRALSLLGAVVFFCISCRQEGHDLNYQPAPADNPLKGFVPYVEIDRWNRFPHSLQFHYFALKDLMTGPDSFDWSPLEGKLSQTEERGCQLILRVVLEYPGRESYVPQFLLDRGLAVTEWQAGEDTSRTPDYADPRLREALRQFIAAFGEKYDGDPRLGFISAGLLGSWGEWHTHPRSDLWAPKETQKEVLDAYQKAFAKTPVLLRYPADQGHWDQADNRDRPFGYHDDSFGWATLSTGRKEDSWFFIPLLRAAEAEHKWKTHPIGGEVRPELWSHTFTGSPHPQEQDFLTCVRETHATWLMDTGLFDSRFPLPEERMKAALDAARLLGYEFHVSGWKRDAEGNLEVRVENRGVAPFYHDWPAELWAGETLAARFDLRNILPGETKIWKTVAPAQGPLRLRVPNPMPTGKSLRFANREQEEDWLILRR